MCYNPPPVLSRFNLSTHVEKEKKKETLKRNHVLLANKKGMYILKRTGCVFLTYYKFIINVCVNIDLE